jgi:methylisocitrate lyase
MENKVKASVRSSEEVSKGEFIICARTDAYSVSGIKETIERSKRYMDQGASMIFPEGLKNI